MKTVIYGIKNCDTMKKARAWLEAHDVDYTFHDYKISGIGREQIKKWIGIAGWEALLNRAGTTFRKLPDDRKQELSEHNAMTLMLEQPSMIKRPVLERGAKLLLGFSPDRYASFIAGGRGTGAAGQD